jgi:hypothetical protein
MNLTPLAASLTARKGCEQQVVFAVSDEPAKSCVHRQSRVEG